MKMNKEVVESRRNAIMKEIQALGTVNVEDLAKKLTVSPITIRRDLQYWEEKGAIERHYGGAKLIQGFVEDDPEFSREPVKHAIAKYAASFVDEGDTIFINTSSTALLVLKYIRGKRCNVITNNGKALFVECDPLVSVFLTGGELRTPKESLTGDFAVSNLQKVYATKAFLGCSGISAENGISTAIMQEVEINQTMIRRTKGQVFVLADHTKIGLDHSFVSGQVSSIDTLITDRPADPAELEKIAAMNVRIRQMDALSPTAMS